jgi:osmotically-inducible protein OsmY
VSADFIIRTGSDIKKDMEDELKYDADVGSTDVAVSVKRGVVTSTGFVRHNAGSGSSCDYARKPAARAHPARPN